MSIAETSTQKSKALELHGRSPGIQLGLNQLAFPTDSLVRIRTKYVLTALFPRGNMMLFSRNILHHGQLIRNR